MIFYKRCTKSIRFCTPFVDENGRNLIKCDLMQVESSKIFDFDSEEYKNILQLQGDISESRDMRTAAGYVCKLVLEKILVDGVIKLTEVTVCIVQGAMSGNPDAALYEPHKPPKPLYPDYPHQHNPMEPVRSLAD